MDAIEVTRYPVVPTLPSVVDRYYSRLYACDVNGVAGEDQCVLVHSNHICVITVAPFHPLLRVSGRSVTSVDFRITESINRLDNKVCGKHKKGGQALMPNSPLCTVTCSDGSAYVLRACVRGTLVEVNTDLTSSPWLLEKHPQTNGYIAVVFPRARSIACNFDGLVSQEEYEKLRNMKVREEKKPTTGDR